MRTEKELKEFLRKCRAVFYPGNSKGPCPLEENNQRGCCAECSFPNTIQWVLGSDNNPSNNGQDIIINSFKNL